MLPDEAAILNDPQNVDVDVILQPYQQYTEDDLLEFLANYTTSPPPVEAGPEAVEYSNLGAGLLGYALEVALGTSYDQLLEVRAWCCSWLMHSCHDAPFVPGVAYLQLCCFWLRLCIETRMVLLRVDLSPCHHDVACS